MRTVLLILFIASYSFSVPNEIYFKVRTYFCNSEIVNPVDSVDVFRMYNLRSDPKITGRWVNDGSHLTFIKPNGKDTTEYLFFTHNCGAHTVGISVYLKDNSVLVTLQDKKEGDLRFISAVGDIITKPLSKVQQVAIH